MIGMQGGLADGQPSLGFVIVALIGAIPILGIVAWTAVRILGPVGQALSRRLGGGSEGGAALLERRVDQLAEELELVRSQLVEAHERLDFTERLLAQGRPPDPLPKR
jgi:hypothetical protein